MLHFRLVVSRPKNWDQTKTCRLLISSFWKKCTVAHAEALISVGPTGGRKGTQNAVNGERIIADSVKRNGMVPNTAALPQPSNWKPEIDMRYFPNPKNPITYDTDPRNKIRSFFLSNTIFCFSIWSFVSQGHNIEKPSSIIMFTYISFEADWP